MLVKNTLFRSELQYTMTHIQHTIYLHNLSIVADICRNVPPVVHCLGDRISLLGPGASLELLRIMSSTRCTISGVLAVAGLPSLSASLKSVRPSSHIWHHFTLAGRNIACGQYTVDISRRISVLMKCFPHKKRTAPHTLTLEYVSS